MTPDPVEKTDETPAIDPEALKDSIREVLGEILPDFFSKEGDELKPEEIDELDKPLTARNAEQMMKGLMKSAMLELNAKKPFTPVKRTSKDEEVEPPTEKKTDKEEPPVPPAKRMSLGDLLWGKNE